MIKTIYSLGHKYLMEGNSSIVQAITLPVEHSAAAVKYVVIVDLAIADQKIHLILKEVDSSTSLDFLWIGTADGAASPQWYGTVRNVEYLLGQTIPNLLERWDREDPYYVFLTEAHQRFFVDLGETQNSGERYRYVFNPDYIGGMLTERDGKKALSAVAKQFQQFVEAKLNVNSKDVLLYSLSLDGQLVVKQPEYERLVLADKLSVFEDAKTGVCALTNQTEAVTGETTKLKFNYYINQKISFASGFDKKSFVKNLSISRDAYQAIMAGEAYILRNFNTRFSGLPCYIIPDFLYDIPFENAPLETISEYIQQFVRTIKTAETAKELHKYIENYRRFEEQMDNYIALHFLFYTKAQASLKINKLVSDVPLTYLRQLSREMRQVEGLGRRFFSQTKFNLGLDAIYYLIPMRVKKGDNLEKRKILHVYESLLTKKPLSYHWLITQFVQLAKIHAYAHYDVYQFNGKKEYNDVQLVDAMIQAQLLLKLLYKLELIKEAKEMADGISYALPDAEIADYMGTMNYTAAQSALFLLGYLIARIGAEQVKKANARAEALGQARTGRTANKPILSKINYHGMSKQRIMFLSNEIPDKLRQLKIASAHNELIYAEHKHLLDAAMQEKWSLSDRESVFYLLSGYAYGTKRILENAKKEKNDKEESK
ncbi:TIGR02556 family CRISPR-associated protein [Anoxybacillus rupiensis]|jgi:CRISPR-associated protein Csh1|uniref:TIGR02556 family CRISPR-associated protein n=1 Tax=Anoxybacteroides rupiense TaxID=311460 RepID=A0ABT5W2B7_9BACL|nr:MULTISPECIES: TIGR02556 family CRISPR-associated protein [Anoxybacillus]MBS2772158.1 TIGR02556 family CRISPR-associated protein [Anoxybacillus rupiensis]MDE8563452.1 TIGR02556 family CRISPR-associated protein [Anoxybacillus rupiensis]QHC02902.1 TIGR02556 family CRISPR-associated protein [Anoxybacillus sp. PDR2]